MIAEVLLCAALALAAWARPANWHLLALGWTARAWEALSEARLAARYAVCDSTSETALMEFGGHTLEISASPPVAAQLVVFLEHEKIQTLESFQRALGGITRLDLAVTAVNSQLKFSVAVDGDEAVLRVGAVEHRKKYNRAVPLGASFLFRAPRARGAVPLPPLAQ